MSPKSAGAAVFVLAGALTLFPFVSSPVALLGGAVLGLMMGNPWPELNRKLTHRLLTLSIIGLGAGMDLRVVGRVGAHGILYTAAGILLTLAAGSLLGKSLGSSRGVSTLVSVGTAICGGSAIAAVAPVIRAKHHDVSVALATVFLLNALALVVFPWVGHSLSLSQEQFGLWSALAIHDTSSVVGSAMQYGKEALQVGTTVKLARALWIVPVALALGWLESRRSSETAGETGPVRRPWFILGFLAAAALVTFVPQLREAGQAVETVARRSLVLTLFLIGSGLTRQTLRAVGLRPLIQGVALWGLVAVASLAAIHARWVTL